MSAELECKKLLVTRCLYAVSLSIAMQFILLTLFLLLVNFSILHPINWISETVRLMFLFGTWLCALPLVAAAVLHGILVAKHLLARPQYFGTKFMYTIKSFPRHMANLVVHALIGFFTIFLYTGYLHSDYRNLIVGSDLNQKFLFLTAGGISIGVYHYTKSEKAPQIQFPVACQSKYIQIRALLFGILARSLGESLIPMIVYAVIYAVFGNIVAGQLSSLLSIENTLAFTLFDLRLAFYTLLLFAQILSNMRVMKAAFTVFLTEPVHFPVDGSDLTLVDAVSMTNVPISCHLGTMELLKLANDGGATHKREPFYALSIPGGHPYNWKRLTDVFFQRVNNFRSEMSLSLEKIPQNQKISSAEKLNAQTATDYAIKLLKRQANEAAGLRNMSIDEHGVRRFDDPHLLHGDETTKRFDDFMNLIQDRCIQFKTYLCNLPGIHYLFVEPSTQRTCHLLAHSQDIQWLCEGVAGLAAHSIKEDKYGVVQGNLVKIIETLLDLKLVLDKLGIITLNGKRLDKQSLALRNSVKRSLYRISFVFGEFMPDLIMDHDRFRAIQAFVQFREV